MNLSNTEKETVIIFNEAEDTAQIETFNARLLRQLHNVAECDGVELVEEGKGYGCYKLPKTMIKIHAPKRNTMTDEQRAAKSEMMKAYNTLKRS